MTRYVPHLPFPPYAYVPGMHPHPISDPAGHSYQVQAEPLDLPADLRRCERFLWGIDLFNAGYYWEAHEAWEAIWLAQKKAGEPTAMIQGLIKLAAAGVKGRAGSSIGVARHAAHALALLSSAAATRLPINVIALQELAQVAAARPESFLSSDTAPVRIIFATEVSLAG